MKITDVEAIVLESPSEYGIPVGGQESQGVKYCLLLKVSTDEGITGWSDVETAPHVAAAVVACARDGTHDVRGPAIVGRGRRPVRRGTSVGQNLPRNHLLRAPGRGHPGAFRLRHRLSRHHRQGDRPSAVQSARGCVSRPGSRLCLDPVSRHARRDEAGLRLLSAARLHGDQVRLGRVRARPQARRGPRGGRAPG